MDSPSPRHRVRGHVPLWSGLAGLLFVTGLLVTIGGLREVGGSLPGPVTASISRHSAPSQHRVGVAAVVPVAVPAGAGAGGIRPMLSVARSVPIAIEVPAIQLAVRISALGLNTNGTVQVPTNPAKPGWYRYDSAPGQLGSAVILGHVDSYLGPAVFFRLRELRPGDKIFVNLTDGTRVEFAVTAVLMYDKVHFPTAAVYGYHDASNLQLVTCGGTFDRATGHYLSNLVVFSSLVGSST